MKQYLRTPTAAGCPVCGSASAQILWSVTSDQAAQHFVLKEKDAKRFSELVEHIENLWGQKSCDVLQCCKCEFCYSWPYKAGDQEFYGLAYRRTGYPAWKWEYQVTCDALEKISNPNLAYLEIGAGNGAFIKQLLSKNILRRDHILCTEYSDYGRQQIERLGARCISADISSLGGSDRPDQFDVICMFQVLEHMDRLDILFQTLAALLKENGSIFLAVPNNKRTEFNELNGGLLDMPPNHVGRWNKKCFEAIGERHGFSVIDHQVEPTTWLSMAPQIANYRFLRRSQQGGTLENKMERINNPMTHKAMKLFGVGVNLALALPVLLQAGSPIGDSQWGHLKRSKA